MEKRIIYIIGLILITISACKKDDFGDPEVVIPYFNFPKTVVFADSLSAYNIFQGTPGDLIPSADFELLELSSSLFTDYAHKQRLVKLPTGTQLTRLNDNSIDFPNGTILTKTFFYYIDERDTSLGKNIIETRLLIKESDKWNAATYRWNDAQTSATLELNGFDKQVTWINSIGSNRSTLYKIPTENQCMTCHQSNSSMTPLGPTILNLNRTVKRNGTNINQLSHMQAIGILNNFSVAQAPHMVDYKDLSEPTPDRARAYLAMNCAHCHNPSAWNIPADKDFDLRFQTSLQGSGIQAGKDRISRNMTNQEMPFIGTTMLDEEGVALILEYLESL